MSYIFYLPTAYLQLTYKPTYNIPTNLPTTYLQTYLQHTYKPIYNGPINYVVSSMISDYSVLGYTVINPS